MKKLLTATLAIAMSATLLGALAACSNNDAETAKKAIDTVRVMYLEKSKETPADYKVIGQTKANEVVCKIDWTVTPAATCEVQNFSDYVSVGEMNEDDNLVTISVSRATVQIDYELKASITVGGATESVSFDRYVPKKTDRGDIETQTTTMKFDDAQYRTVITPDQQVWEQNGVKLTNDKADSTTDVNNNGAKIKPAHFYKGSKIKIEYPGMLQLVFHSGGEYNNSDYPAYLESALKAANLVGAQITLDKSNTSDITVTVELSIPVDIIEFKASAGQIQLFSIDFEGVVGGATDENKVEAAKSSLDIELKNYNKTGEYELPATSGSASVTWAVKGTSANVAIESGKLKVTSLPATETEVTLVATIKSGDVTDTKEITIKVIDLGLTNDGTLAHPYTPTEAKKVALLLEENATSAEEVYVKGYVILPGTYSSQYNNFDNLYIAEVYAADKTETADDAFYVFRPVADGTVLTSAGLTKGDLVVFKGKLQHYVKGDTHTPELTAGGTCVERTAAADLNKGDQEKVDTAKANLALDATYYAGTVNLPASQNGASLTWAVKTGTIVSITDNVLTITNPEAETTVTLTATITSGNVTDTKDISFKVVRAPAGTAEEPFTVAYAKMVGGKLEDKQYLKDESGAEKAVYVKGYIVDVGTWSDQYSNFTGVYIVDEYSENAVKTDGIQLYRLGTDAQFVTGQYSIHKGDLITVCGYIQRYTVGQVSSNSAKVNPYVVAMEAAPRTDEQKIADAFAVVKSTLDNITATGEVTLPTSVEADVTFAWTLAEGTTAATLSEDGKKLVVSTLPATDTEVTLTLTATCGATATDTKTVTVVIKAPVDTSKIATIDFSSITDKGTGITDGDATALFATYCSDARLTKVMITKAYKGNGTGGGTYENKGGLLKFGTGKASGKLVLTFSDTVKCVTISCTGWSGDKIKVNNGEEQALDNLGAAKSYSFNTDSKEITIDTNKRVLIFSITVEFAGDTGTEGGGESGGEVTPPSGGETDPTNPGTDPTNPGTEGGETNPTNPGTEGGNTGSESTNPGTEGGDTNPTTPETEGGNETTTP